MKPKPPYGGPCRTATCVLTMASHYKHYKMEVIGMDTNKLKANPLNKAIYQVLTAKFKKDAPEAFELVKAAGYDIYKMGGDWVVSNDQTKRTIYLVYGRRTTCYIHHHNKDCYQDYKATDLFNFDYAGCLNKPVNKEYYTSIEYTKLNPSKAVQAYEKLKSAKWHVTYHESEEQRILQKIADLQKELVRVTESKMRDRQRYAECRKEVGLK